MSDDYLWDRSGEPDPEVVRLEQQLSGLAYRPSPLDLSDVPVERLARRSTWLDSRWLKLVPVAGALILAFGVYWTWARLEPIPPSRWVAVAVNGRPMHGAKVLRSNSPLASGVWIETDSSSTAHLRDDGVGDLEIGPGSRLRVVAARPGESRFVLDRGVLRAVIWAPPGRFAVETPSATALDLGCSYALEIDGSGAGRLLVTAGWVGLNRRNVEALVPAGAACPIRSGHGPGTPYFLDAPAALVSALATIDGGPADQRAAAIDAALAAARVRDAFTLWHLLARADDDLATRVGARLAELAPPPPPVTLQQVLKGDRAALDAWWNSFGLGDRDLFRLWRARPDSK